MIVMTNAHFFKELFDLLEHEQELLERVADLAMQQQHALIRFNADDVERIAAEQEMYSHQMNECETQRINLISMTLGISMHDARALKLSELRHDDDVEVAEQLATIR